MPSALTYPGVYVEEIPSGVRTITGVATSITAFIGRARRGELHRPYTINSFGDFERSFGGLWTESTLGFAVRDFFLNGGSQAIVVRLYHADPGSPQANPPVPAPAMTQSIAVGDMAFKAASPGAWGANLRVAVDTDKISDDVATAMGVAKADLFNLTVRDAALGGRTERFLNLTVKDSARRVDNVLLAGSELLRYDGTPDATKAPKAEVDAISKKETAWIDAKKALTAKQIADPAHPDPEKTKAADAKKAFDDAVAAAAAALSNGLALTASDFFPQDGETLKQGLFALEKADIFNLLCIPPYTAGGDVDVSVVSAAAAYCERRRAMLLVDAPISWVDTAAAVTGFGADPDQVGTRSRNAALFFPRLKKPNPLHDDQLETFAACGTVAGVFARTDAQRGVWKAPAGLDATLVGVPTLAVPLTDGENGELNPLGINCLRAFPAAGRVVWGARTLRGADQLADEYKYVPVRRTALYIEESLYRGLKWVVFEPNDEPLWAQIRLNVGAFMHNLFRQGAFQGTTPRDAYFVKCDKETTTQNDIDLGIVNVVVGFAPLKPAEFVVIKLQQIAGQIQA
jgi:phage tail sheath protein FI